jgi:hypothetical protein
VTDGRFSVSDGPAARLLPRAPDLCCSTRRTDHLHRVTTAGRGKPSFITFKSRGVVGGNADACFGTREQQSDKTRNEGSSLVLLACSGGDLASMVDAGRPTFVASGGVRSAVFFPALVA